MAGGGGFAGAPTIAGGGPARAAPPRPPPPPAPHDDGGERGSRGILDDRGRGPRARRRLEEIVPVARRTAHGDDQRTGTHGAAVVRDRGDRLGERAHRDHEEAGACERVRDLREAHPPHGARSSRTVEPAVACSPAGGSVALAAPAASTAPSDTRKPARCSAYTARRTGSPRTSGMARATIAATAGRFGESLRYTYGTLPDSVMRTMESALVTLPGSDAVASTRLGTAARFLRSSEASRAAIAACSTVLDTGAAALPP